VSRSVKISRKKKYTTNEAAKFLGVTSQTVRIWLNDPDENFTGEKTGKSRVWQITGAEIERFMKKYNYDLSGIVFVP
jgi:transposase